jgi:O-antigen/teichoic acid export membrane protein
VKLDLRRVTELMGVAGASALLTMSYIVVTGRLLGPAEYSDFSAALSLIYFFAVTTSPMTPTVGRMVARLNVRGDHAGIATLRNAVIRRAVLWCGLAAGTGIALSPWIARWLNFRSAAAVALALTASSLCAIVSVDRGLLHGLLQVRQYNLNTFVEAFVRCFGALALLLWVSASAAASLSTYVAGFAAAELMILFSFRGELKSEGRAVDWTEFKRLLVPMSILMIAVAVFQNTDMLAVKRWMPASQAGFYGAASALGRSFGVVFVPLYVFSGPVLAAAHEQRRRVTAEALRLCGWFVAASVVPLTLFVLWPRPLVTLLYGKTFAPAASLIVPVAGVAIVTYLALLAVQVFITLGDFRFLSVYAVAAALQIVLLALYHDSFRTVLTVLYVCQSAVLLIVGAMLYRVRDA